MARMTVEQALAVGHQHLEAGRLDQAELVVRALLESAAQWPAVQRLAGLLAYWRGQTPLAAEFLRKAAAMAPTWTVAYENLSFLLQRLGQFEESEAAARQALTLAPSFAAHCNLAQALREQCRFSEAIEHFQAALELDPNAAVTRSGMLYLMHFLPGTTPEALADAHAEWDRRCAAPLPSALPPLEADRDPNRPLRVGFVSPDLGRHPVGYFLYGLLEHLRDHNFAVYCYSGRRLSDDWTERIAAASDGWRPIAMRPDAEVAQLVRDDRIDILFDLAGHTAENRLLVFARKPAPVQITWMGYVGTTGLAAIDYLLADRWHVPPGAEANYREQVLRMPNGYICYRAPEGTPQVSPLPARQRGYVTFGSFNKATKFNPDVIALWAEILRRVPSARLTLRNKGLGQGSLRQRVLGQFHAAGIQPDRLELLDWASAEELMANYNHIDVALDTFPYSGGLTTCEALWMGVPVVTCPGSIFASRHSLSHLSNAGFTETIASDPADYVTKAVSLAGDLPRLARIRSELRGRMQNSPLCQSAHFAADLADLLRGVWRAKGQDPVGHASA